MLRYLSDEWFDRVADHDSDDGHDRVAALTLQQVVTGGPDGDVVYAVVVDERGARLRRGPSSDADVTFTSDYATSAGIARGAVSVQAALNTGRIRIGGDTSVLASHQQLLMGIDPVPDSVRAITTWGDD